MKKNCLSVTAILVASFLWSACGNNSENTTTSDTTMTTTTDTGMSEMSTNNTAISTTPLNDDDKKFVMKAAAGGMMEVELGKTAQQNGANQRVKDFGAMMERDHSKANDELKNLASAKGITFNNDSLMNLHKSNMDKMKNKTGKDFDKAYMSMMVDDHKKDVNEFKEEANKASDPDLKNWVNNTLPVLQTHLDSAQAINKGVH